MSGTEHAVQSYLILTTGDRIPTTHPVAELEDAIRDESAAAFAAVTLAHDPVGFYGFAGDRILVGLRHIAAIIQSPGRNPR